MIKEFYEEEFYDITLVSRTLYKDGGWNTLCLPFNLEDFNGTPLEGATVKTLNSSSIANGTLTLNFSSATSIAAGSPYIVKWDKADDYVDDNDHNLHEPTFCHVRIRQELHPVDQAAIDFIGSYSPVSFAKDDKTKLYIGADNKLYYPGTVTTIGSFRAYFQLANALTDVSTGDVNGDGSISVTDVTFLVDKILGNVNENFVMENADVNGDGYISVTDVTALVNIILGNDSSTFTIVTNLDDIPITFGGGGSGPARVSKNLK
jgi:hypothetical protein